MLPAAVAEAQIAQVMAALRWGVAASDLDLAQPSLEALAALARFNTAAPPAGQANRHNGTGGPHLQLYVKGQHLMGSLTVPNSVRWEDSSHLNPEEMGSPCCVVLKFCNVPEHITIAMQGFPAYAVFLLKKKVHCCASLGLNQCEGSR